MPYVDTLVAVALIWIVAAVTPGPNFFIVVHGAVREESRFPHFIVLGIVVGTLIWAIFGYFGVAVLFSAVPCLYYFLKVAGGSYLVYIGCFFLFFGRKCNAKHSIDVPTPMSCFRSGLMTNLLNPKTAAFMSSLFAAVVSKDSPADIGVLCMLLICSISAVWYSLVAVLFSSNCARGGYNRYRRSIERLAGGIFIAFGVKLAASE
ncbi:MAG: lysine transporter LysE [Desulfovibrio sp.]|nr:MAG: lysine transporter LysE [Desulfovibrio sp.]